MHYYESRNASIAPIIQYGYKTKWSIRKERVKLMLNRVQLFFYLRLSFGAMPSTIANQVHAVCMAEARNVNEMQLVRTSWKTFELRQGNQRTYWRLHLSKMKIF